MGLDAEKSKHMMSHIATIEFVVCELGVLVFVTKKNGEVVTHEMTLEEFFRLQVVIER